MSTRKRLALATAGVGAVAVIAALGTVGTNALFNNQAPSQSNSITAGTVSLEKGTTSSTSQTCTITNAAPGDQPTPCVYTANYTGSLNAVMLLNVSIKSDAASPNGTAGSTGTKPLYDGTANGLQVSVTGLWGTSAGNPSPFVRSSKFQTPAWPTSGDIATADNQWVYPSGNGGAKYFKPGQSETFTVLAALPSWAENEYQGSSATITLTAHVVQYQSNHDCYVPACNLNSPFVTNVTATAGAGSTPAQIQLIFNNGQKPVSADLGHNSMQDLLNEFSVVDQSQSGTTPVTAAVTGWSLNTATDASGNVAGTVATLSLGNLTGSILEQGKTYPINSGDYLDLTYTANPAGPFVVFVDGGADPYWGADNTPMTFSLIPVG